MLCSRPIQYKIFAHQHCSTNVLDRLDHTARHASCKIVPLKNAPKGTNSTNTDERPSSVNWNKHGPSWSQHPEWDEFFFFFKKVHSDIVMKGKTNHKLSILFYQAVNMVFNLVSLGILKWEYTGTDSFVELASSGN